MPEEQFFCVSIWCNQAKYWVGQKVHLGFFFCKMKNTSFIFTIFIDTDILSIKAISCSWLLVGRGQGHW